MRREGRTAADVGSDASTLTTIAASAATLVHEIKIGIEDRLIT
jgi:hypothetical protein